MSDEDEKKDIDDSLKELNENFAQLALALQAAEAKLGEDEAEADELRERTDAVEKGVRGVLEVRVPRKETLGLGCE